MLDVRRRKCIANRKRVCRSQLIIDAWTDSDPALWNPEYLSVRINDEQGIRVQGCAVDNRAVVNCSAVDRKEEGRKLAQRTLQAATVLLE
jgi:hypothetical protein